MKKAIFIFSFSIFIMAMFSICAFAGELEFSAVHFVSGGGSVITSYPTVGSSVYAKVTVKNNSGAGADVILLAGCYNSSGVLERVFSEKRAFSADESDTLSLKIDIPENNLEVVVNAFIFDGKLNPCMKNATMLKDSTDLSYIKINGQKLSGYTNSKDDYSIEVNTPEADVVAVAKDATTSVSVKKIYIPGKIKVNVTSQFGITRTVFIDCETTNKAKRPIIDEHLILKADSSDNTGGNVLDKDAEVWTDISGYGNDITLSSDSNNKWTDNGFSSVCAKDVSPTVLPQIVCDTLNSSNFTLQFALSSVSTVSKNKCPVMSSSNNNFAIYIEKEGNLAYCKFGGAAVTSMQPSVTKNQMLEGTNTIVVNSADAVVTMKWYVNDKLISTKSIPSAVAFADSVIFSALYTDLIKGEIAGYAGTAIIKSLSIYNRALTADEIEVQNE